MAYVNVSEWIPEHVAEWLRGLEECILPYVHFFLNNEIDGNHLLNLTPEDLKALHIVKIGHQELILEAVDLLRQLHYGLTLETLQFLALKLGCKARSLHNYLKLNGPPDELENGKQERVSTDILSSVSDILVSVKALVSWLDRYPFQYQEQYITVKKAILKLSIELASTAQRDQFAERPHQLIKASSLELADLCDKIVQEFNDSLIIQPASLDIATIKKKPDEELGMHIQSTYSGVHIISSIKLQSPATRCAKVEEGDEIVQVNYQTVTGWHLKSFLEAMKEHPTEIHLTLKKRPRHTNILGQIIVLRPYRIPSKKTAFGKAHKWSEGNLSLHIQDVYSTSTEGENPRCETNDDDDDSAFLPDTVAGNLNNAVETNFRYRMLPYTSHVTVQRRATVSGASPTVLKAPVNIEDLVNGVPIIVRKDNIGRSISHDPCKLSAPSKDHSTAKSLDDIKADNFDECVKTTTENCTLQENACNETAEEVQSLICSANSSVLSNNKNTSPTPTDEINIPEEENIILENKSLREMKVNLLDGDTICGLQHNVQNISDAAVGPVNLNAVSSRKATNLNTSSNADSYIKEKNCNDLDSFQVKAGGVIPQKHLPPVADQRKDPENIVLKRSGIAGKFGNRKISCKDLGMGDCQGWLYKQRDKKGFFPISSQWTKRWIILKNHYLYSYKDRNDAKAECLIFLPGSTVSPAMGCKSKKFCFKVCQMNVSFYFATETQNDLSKWMNKMGLAAIAYDASSDITSSGFLRPEVVLCVENTFYSETDDSDDSYSLEKRPGYGDMLQRPLHMQPPVSSMKSQLQKKVDRTHSVNDLKTKFLKPEKNFYYHIRSGYHPHLSLQPEDGKTCPNRYSKNHGMHSTSDSAQSHFKCHKISYNRSFSCNDSTNTHLNDKKEDSIARKFSYGNNSANRFQVNDILSTGLKSQSTKSITDEEYDILTSSLGRQKPVAKEIAPGLVARMAVSYSNLSHKNTAEAKSAGKMSVFKDIPSPGYVAKISDSFDHLARDKSSNKCHYFPKNKIGKRTIDTEHVKNPIKRNSSESEVYQSRQSSSHKSLIHNSHLSEHAVENTESNRPIPEKLISRLDRDHYRLYGRKKISPSSRQFSPSPDSPCMSSVASDRMMRFFPNEEISIQKGVNNANHINSKRVCDSSVTVVDQKISLKKLSPLSGFGPGDGTISLGSHVFPPNTNQFSPNYKMSSSNENINDLQGQTSQIFTSAEVASSFCQGIENVGFYSPEQEGHSTTNLNIKYSNYSSSLSSENDSPSRQSARTDSLCEYSKFEFDPNLPPKSATLDSPGSKSSFKFFGSPKFIKKLTSPKLDKRNIFKSKKQAKEIKKAEQSDISNVRSERKLFGSPRLAQAIFGSPKVGKKNAPIILNESHFDTLPEVSTNEKSNIRLIRENKTKCNEDTFVGKSHSRTISAINSKCEIALTELNKSSSNSSLNSDASGSIMSASTSSLFYVGNRMKPKVSITIPLVADKSEERVISPETPRTPLKPTMGVMMLGKRRLPSLSGESSISLSSSKSSHEEPANEQSQSYSESKTENSEISD